MIPTVSVRYNTMLYYSVLCGTLSAQQAATLPEGTGASEFKTAWYRTL